LGIVFFLPFLWGLRKANKFELAGLAVILVVIGIGKSVDKFNGLYFGWPIWLAISWRGIKEFL
jgi:hypothetical protein